MLNDIRLYVKIICVAKSICLFPISCPQSAWDSIPSPLLPSLNWLLEKVFPLFNLASKKCKPSLNQNKHFKKAVARFYRYMYIICL